MKSARPGALILAALFLAAASPAERGLRLQVPARPDLPTTPALPSASTAPAPIFQPAPTPNRDIDGPTSRADTGTSVSPSLFTRSETYRGEGFDRNNTAQSDQDKRAKPAAGFSLHMPLTSN